MKTEEKIKIVDLSLVMHSNVRGAQRCKSDLVLGTLVLSFAARPVSVLLWICVGLEDRASFEFSLM